MSIAWNTNTMIRFGEWELYIWSQAHGSIYRALEEKWDRLRLPTFMQLFFGPIITGIKYLWKLIVMLH